MRIETIELSPTAYEVYRQKQAKKTQKQLAREFNQQLKIAMNGLGFIMTARHTTGSHLIALQRVAAICELYNQPTPDNIRFLIALYEQAEKQSLINWSERLA